MMRIVFLFCVFFCATQATWSSSSSGQATARWEELGQDWIELEQASYIARHPSPETLFAWLGGLSEEGFQSLKGIMDRKSHGAKKRVMNCAVNMALTAQDLKRLNEACGDLWDPSLFFEDFQQGHMLFLERAVPMMRKLILAWGVPNGVFLKESRGTNTSEYKALFTELRALEDARFEILSAADLPIYQLQMILYAGAHVETPLLPLLLSFFEDVRATQGEDRPGGRKDASKAVLKAFERLQVPLLATVANAQVCPQTRLEMLEEMWGVCLRQARLAATLLGADPGRHTSNLFHKLRESVLEDAELDALEALPQASRRYQFVVSHAPLDGADLESVRALFVGCTADDAYHMEREISSYHPPLAFVARINQWDFTPPQRAAMLRQMSLQRVESDLSPDTCQELIGLFKALSKEWDHHQTMGAVRFLAYDDAPDYEGFLRYGRALLACGFEPEVCENLIHPPLHVEALLPLKGILEGLDPLQKETVLRSANGLKRLTARTMELVHGARFDKDLIPKVMERAWWLEAHGWNAPSHFDALKGILQKGNLRWADLNLSVLLSSGLNAQGFEAIGTVEPSPSFCYEILLACQWIDDKTFLPPTCVLMAGHPKERQKALFKGVTCGIGEGYGDVLGWALPTMVELSFPYETVMVLLSRLVPGPHNNLLHDPRRIGPDHLRTFKARLDAQPYLRQTKLIDDIITQAEREKKASTASS